MFREMRRKNQALSLEECIDILERGTSGVLAVAGDDGYPYAVPLSYVFDKKTSKLYFHGARKGIQGLMYDGNANRTYDRKRGY